VLVLYMIIVIILTPFILSIAGVLTGDLIKGLVKLVVDMCTPTSLDSLGLILPLCLSLGFQMGMNRYVFFVGTAANAWLRYPAWYGLFDYNLLYTNALIGVTIAIGRIVTLLVFFVLFIARLDKTTMPGPRGGFLNYDPAFKAYIGMLRMDHRYNNPLFLCFGDIMLHQLSVSRIRRILRRARRVYVRRQGELRAAALQAAAEAKGEAADEAELAQVARTTRMKLMTHHLMELAYDVQHERAVLARNRWQLAWRLMQQPFMRRCRQEAHMRKELAQVAKERALAKAQGRAEIGETDVGLSSAGAPADESAGAPADEPAATKLAAAAKNTPAGSTASDPPASTASAQPAVTDGADSLHARLNSVLGQAGGTDLLLRSVLESGGEQVLRKALDSLGLGDGQGSGGSATSSPASAAHIF